MVDRQLVEDLSDGFAARGPTTRPRARGVTQDQAVDLKSGGDSLSQDVVLAGMQAEESFAQLEMSPLRASARRRRKSRSFVWPALAARRVAAGVKEGAFKDDLTTFGVAQEAPGGRARDDWLALIGRKSGRIACEPWLRMGAATEDGEGVVRASFAMA